MGSARINAWKSPCTIHSVSFRSRKVPTDSAKDPKNRAYVSSIKTRNVCPLRVAQIGRFGQSSMGVGFGMSMPIGRCHNLMTSSSKAWTNVDVAYRQTCRHIRGRDDQDSKPSLTARLAKLRHLDASAKRFA